MPREVVGGQRLLHELDAESFDRSDPFGCRLQVPRAADFDSQPGVRADGRAYGPNAVHEVVVVAFVAGPQRERPETEFNGLRRGFAAGVGTAERDGGGHGYRTSGASGHPPRAPLSAASAARPGSPSESSSASVGGLPATTAGTIARINAAKPSTAASDAAG